MLTGSRVVLVELVVRVLEQALEALQQSLHNLLCLLEALRWLIGCLDGRLQMCDLRKCIGWVHKEPHTQPRSSSCFPMSPSRPIMLPPTVMCTLRLVVLRILQRERTLSG